MARTPPPRRTSAATEPGRSAVESREELKRTLERDTAVQGERGTEAAAAARSPSGAERAPPAARPARSGKTRKR